MRRSVLVTGLAIVLGGVLAAAAQRTSPRPTSSPSKPKPGTRTKPRQPLTAAQEQRAILFARQHHPELEKLVGRLKTSRKGAYRKAVRELYRTADRLGRLQKSNPKRYGLVLELWQLESQARLLVARSMMRSDPKLDEQLKSTLRRRASLRLQMLRSDRERSRVRLERLEDQIRELEDLDASTERELQRLQKSTRIGRSRRRSKSRPTVPTSKSNVTRPAPKPGRPVKRNTKNRAQP